MNQQQQQQVELRNPVETIHKHCDAWKIGPVSSFIIHICLFRLFLL